MRRHDEVMDADSCLNRALPNELMFVLLARDKAAPAAVRAWINERIRLGLNNISDEQIIKAIKLADDMVLQRDSVREALGKS